MTGSETDPTLEDQLFENLSIRKPDVYLGVECENLNELTGQVMSKFVEVSTRESIGCSHRCG